MKRTALKRGTKQLKTYQPLRRFTELRRTRLSLAVSVRGASDGDGTPEGGAPRRRSRGHKLPAEVRQLVAERSGGVCEAQMSGCEGRATEMHHRITQKAGGRHGAARDRSDRASNLLHLDSWCHGVVTRSPGASLIEGWSLLENQEPTREPLLYRGELSYLADDGRVGTFAEVGA